MSSAVMPNFIAAGLRAPQSPGLQYVRVPRTPALSPLRTDVAGFIGRTRRGPIGVPVRVEGWKRFLREFGDVVADADTSYAIRGYFENEGAVDRNSSQVAWVVRVEPAVEQSDKPVAASVTWDIGPVDANNAWTVNAAAPVEFPAAKILIEASSPGPWGNSVVVDIRYRREGVSGGPEVDLAVRADREITERFSGLTPDTLVDVVNAGSALIRLSPLGAPPGIPANMPGRRTATFGPLQLQGGWIGRNWTETRVAYLESIRALCNEPEVALIAMPDLHVDFSPSLAADAAEQQRIADGAREIAERALRAAADTNDRLVLLDVPPTIRAAGELIEWAQSLSSDDPEARRAGAVYHPRLKVLDPLGGIARPLRTIAPSGHVAGLISRLDRERGAHHTPANAEVWDAVDICCEFTDIEHGLLNVAGVNLIRCMRGRGLQVWGGRTLDPQFSRRFVAHRRLIHRLVRAVRLVGEALVFENNASPLWLALVRGVTSVLLEAFRGGALKGEAPEQAFRVTCDGKNNPPEQRAIGQVLCEIEVAPAAPMEFILLQVSVSGDGELEVFEP